VSWNSYNNLDSLLGKNVKQVFWTDEELGFTFTDGTWAAFVVYGDCCSWSYLYDFHGVKKLIENGPIVSVKALDADVKEDGELECYGWEIVTEHPVWGEQTSVFSFRNESNGYYGGWIQPNAVPSEGLWVSEITDDVYGS
jgi:hypothetical protein